jgi:replicative DNA helicase
MFGASSKFMASVVAHATLDEYMGFGGISHLFKNDEIAAFALFDAHVKKYASIPSPEVAQLLIGDVPKAPEPPQYYLDFLSNRHFENILTKGSEGANDLLQKDKAKEAALFLVNQLVPELMKENGNRLIDFRDAYEIVLANYYQQFKQGDEYGIKMGYPPIDTFGGLVGGDILSLVGRPANGKTFLVLRAAHKIWAEQHKPPAFISLEMNNLITSQRLVAMDGGVPLSNLKLQHGQGLTTVQMQKLKAAQGAAKKSQVPFHLMDGNLKTTVEDIYNFCRFTKPSCVLVDGAYMLKHPNQRLGRFERVAENCELLKQEIAGNLKIPVIASWQFSRDAAKKANTKGGSKPGLEDIGYSDAIGQISSVVLGMMEEETVESITRKTVTVLKGRGGEVGSFDINWQFNPVLNFDHYVPEEAATMSFL